MGNPKPKRTPGENIKLLEKILKLEKQGVPLSSIKERFGMSAGAILHLKKTFGEKVQ